MISFGPASQARACPVVPRTTSCADTVSLADRISVMHGGKIVQAATPIEVYRNPAARFVAGFIGNPSMNFLPATPAGTGKWTVAGETFMGPNTDAAALEFAIRTEDLAPADKGLPTTARIVEPLGAHLLVTCDVGGHQFRTVLDSDLTIKPGDRLTLAPQADRIRWFDPETTQVVA